MPYHTLFYTATTTAATNLDTTPGADLVIPVSNAHFFPNQDMFLYGGFFFGAALTQVTLVTPKSRTVVPPKLTPLNGSLNTADRPHMFDRRNNPFKLNMVEEVSMQITTTGTVSLAAYLVMFWGSSLDQVPAGDIYSLHGTSSTAATAGAWSTVTVTWDQTLPQGTYAVIGSQHQSATALAHRFFFRPQLFRPGFISTQSLSNITDPTYYFGGYGVLGSFNTYTYPAIEVLCTGADASHDIIMNMIKTA